MPVIPRPAASVLVLRSRVAANTVNDREDFEIFMVRRHPRSIFVPDVYVFPGGCLDDEDFDPAMVRLCSGIDADAAQRLLPDAPDARAPGFWVAALRETFEEAGLLLAYEEDGSLLSLADEDRRTVYESHRRALLEGRATFAGILEKERLTLAADRLHYFSHWITPELSPYRYDVRFFLAEAPPEQEGSHDGRELTDNTWVTPREALARCERGLFGMVLPTIMNLVEVEAFPLLTDALHATAGKSVPAVLTRMIEMNGDFIEVLPDDCPLPSPPAWYGRGDR